MTVLLIILFCPLLVCWSLWLVFAAVAALPKRMRGTGDGAGLEAFKIDVLIPAHDEELMLPRLLETLRNQTVSGSVRRVLVVADHCSDSTAEVARRGGAEVLERSSGPRGKPGALRDGLEWLKGPHTVDAERRGVLILDADCTVSANFIGEIVAATGRGARVVQSAYILESGQSGHKLGTPATIAFALKNVVRPRGMGRLGIPTQLFGTGMCFRAEVLERIRFEDHLTEDLKISQELLLAGIYPVFVGEAVVTSPLPAERKGMTTQKMRWETGQVQTWGKLPGMLFRLAIRGRFAGILALIDWSAPPVAMGIVYWVALAGVNAVLVIAGLVSAWTMLLPACAMAMLILYVLIGATQTSGVAGTVRLVFSIPRFFFWKMSLYVRMATGKGARTWQKTERGAEASAGAHEVRP